MNKEWFRFSVGSFECFAIRDYSQRYPMNWLLNDVPAPEMKEALEALSLPGDRLNIDFNCLLINTGREKVLIDTGWGTSIPEKQGRLTNHLHEIGVDPEEIHWVLLTHGDRDHAAGLLRAGGEMTFPNARILVAEEVRDFWTGLNRPETSELVQSTFDMILDLYSVRITVADLKTEVLPGIRRIAAPGHRPGHTAWMIKSKDQSLLHGGDAIVHPILITNTQWQWPYHSDPAQAARDRRHILETAVRERSLLFGAHFPFPALGTVKRDAGSWTWQPKSC